MEFKSCLQKQKELKEKFNISSSLEIKYQKIIELGRTLPPFDPSLKIEENRVEGCQSLMYLHTSFQNSKVFFNADSDALISKGLAAILISVYSEEPPEAVLECPPTFLSELGIQHALSQGRSNGFLSLYLKMRSTVLKNLSCL